MGVSENEKLELNIAATIQFSFGSICDRIASCLGNNANLAQEVVENLTGNPQVLTLTNESLVAIVREVLDENAARNIHVLQRETRNHGNNSIRVIENHLQHFRVLRRHHKDAPNADRIAKNHTRNGVQNGDS